MTGVKSITGTFQTVYTAAGTFPTPLTAAGGFVVSFAVDGTWDIFTPTRRYQADGAAAWGSATAAAKAKLGFYGAFVGDYQQVYI